MRSIVLLLLIAIGAQAHAQHLTYDEWQRKALQDMRLAPRFGGREKNAEQKASDAEFVALMLATDSVPRSASNTLVAHGFERLRAGDLTAAMYRFNQAFLMDSTNTDIYWGYGAFFMEVDRPMIAHTMFRAGLSIDSTNVHLLTDEATAYIAERHALASTDSAYAEDVLNNAIGMLERALRHDPGYHPALQRMVICQAQRGDCRAARTWFMRYDKSDAPLEDKVLVGEMAKNCVQR
ncbi:MAG: hypothetical protein IPL52_05320 [Flavobacteriales bacterium]|nr:hypothetical protein [Flavobacteriales bacterium]